MIGEPLLYAITEYIKNTQKVYTNIAQFCVEKLNIFLRNYLDFNGAFASTDFSE